MAFALQTRVFSNQRSASMPGHQHTMLARPLPPMRGSKKEGATMTKKEKVKPAKDALYLLKWGDASKAAEDVQLLRDELKVLEKVSKEAVWFSVKEGSQGSKYVLVVTNDAKQARKYGLMELTQEVEQVQLEGVAEPVSIPVAALKASLMQEADSSSESDSSDEEDMMMGSKATEKAMKKSEKKEKKMKDSTSKMEMPATVAEDPAAAQQAAEIMGAIVGTMEAHGQQARRKLGDAVLDVVEQTKPLMDAADQDSSDSSESDEEMCEKKGDKMSEKQGVTSVEGGQQQPMQAPRMQMQMDGSESSESESSGSESEQDESQRSEKMQMKLQKQQKKATKKAEKAMAKQEAGAVASQ